MWAARERPVVVQQVLPPELVPSRELRVDSNS
jgi:hypothetical protein